MIVKPTYGGDKPVHRITLGDFELTILSDGTYRIDGGAMFGIIPKIMWEKRIQADERNTIPMALNSLLVRNLFTERLEAMSGRLLPHLFEHNHVSLVRGDSPIELLEFFDLADGHGQFLDLERAGVANDIAIDCCLGVITREAIIRVGRQW
jgi:hypothetical protein